MDLKVLNTIEKAKFQTFMEIRNQLMHNITASNYENCFKCLPAGKDNWLLNQYPQPKHLKREKALEAASKSLANEVFKLITNLYKYVQEKEEKDKIAPSLQLELDV